MVRITKEELKEAIEKALFKCIKDSPLEEIGYVGGGLYYLGSGCYTSEKGWEQFKEELKRQAIEKYGEK
jgi:hypothetical protein